MLLTPAFRPALRATVGSRVPTAVRAGVAFSLVYLLPACRLVDAVPTAPPVATDHQGWAADVTNVASTNGVTEGTAGLDLEALASLTQTGDTDWTLEKTGSLTGTTVTWNITATEVATVSGQLVVEGALVLTNAGDGPAPIGNVVVNLQARVGSQWVTRSSDIANATQGDAATSAAIHAKASSENLGSFSENSASGVLTFTDALTDAPVALVPTLVVASGQTRPLRYTAVFDNTDALLQLAPGTAVRAEVIVTFGNATVNGNSTANVDINSNGVIDQDEARVRSVAERVGLTVPAAPNGAAPVLSDALEDITTTGTVTFGDAQFTLGATNGTVTATVDGGTTGGTITNCARLANTDQSINLQDCATVDVPGTPATCTVPGSPGCPWETADVVTRTQAAWDATTNWYSAYDALYASTSGIVEIGIPGTAGFSMRFTNPAAATNYFVQTGPVGALSADLIDPTTSSSGAFGGQVLALRMNVDFSASGALGGSVEFGSLHLCSMADITLNDRTVSEVLGIADTLLGGGSNGYTIVALTDLASGLNSSFVNGIPSIFAQAHLVNGTCP